MKREYGWIDQQPKQTRRLWRLLEPLHHITDHDRHHINHNDGPNTPPTKTNTPDPTSNDGHDPHTTTNIKTAHISPPPHIPTTIHDPHHDHQHTQPRTHTHIHPTTRSYHTTSRQDTRHRHHHYHNLHHRPPPSPPMKVGSSATSSKHHPHPPPILQHHNLMWPTQLQPSWRGRRDCTPMCKGCQDTRYDDWRKIVE